MDEIKLNKSEKELVQIIKSKPPNSDGIIKKMIQPNKRGYNAAKSLEKKGLVSLEDKTRRRKTEYRELFGGVGGTYYTDYEVVLTPTDKLLKAMNIFDDTDEQSLRP